MKKTHIIWDWNGTLLDDTDMSVDVINVSLKKHGLPLLSVDKYRNVFGFPVKDYYKKIGFDFETKHDWEEVANDFIVNYFNSINDCTLSKGAVDVLNYFEEKGFSQVVISAMEHNKLIESLKHFGIFQYFEEIKGIDSHYADSKLHNAEAYIEKHKDANIFMIGDTLHDAEIAKHCKLEAFMFSGGHQTKERLAVSGFKVLDSLKELLNYF